MNESTKRYLLIVGVPVLLAALLIGGWFGYQAWTNRSVIPTVPSEVVFTADPEKQPSLDRELAFPASFPANARTIVRNQVTELKETLTENPSDFGAWLDLAIQYKTIEDYEGAREVWEYVNVAAPKQSISFQNLGNLYGFYLKDYPKAEANYLQAIKNAPTQTNPYLGLHELYRYSYKQNTSAAVEILEKGMKAIGSPNNFDLLTMLAGYYKEKGDIKNARKYYTEARDLALTLNNPTLVNQLEAELGALK